MEGRAISAVILTLIMLLSGCIGAEEVVEEVTTEENLAVENVEFELDLSLIHI